jgi:hypothetical protein
MSCRPAGEQLPKETQPPRFSSPLLAGMLELCGLAVRRLLCK